MLRARTRAHRRLTPLVRALALALALTVAAGCGESVNHSVTITQPSTDATSNMAFAYTGAGGGSYIASGILAPYASSTTRQYTSWAAAWTSTSDVSTTIFANVALTSGLANTAFIIINRESPGTVTITPDCSPLAVPACNFVYLSVGATLGGATQPTYGCWLDSGTITLASISNTNAKGSFSGSGVCYGSATGVTPFAMTNGTFDVAVTTIIPGST